MREPAHAASVVGAMAKAVKIPVTVKMRAGWNDAGRNAPELAERVQDVGAAAVTIHGRTAEQSYSGAADWDLVSRVAGQLTIPVLGSGDCVEARHVVERMAGGVSGVLVGRGVLRNPWILSQAADLAAGRSQRQVTCRERGEFLRDYMELLLTERAGEEEGFRHAAPGAERMPRSESDAGSIRFEIATRGRDRWVINKMRALCAWYSKGLDGGSHLRVRINSAASLADLRCIIDEFFFAPAAV
jgi:tRNA-dihydrouridine synthase